MSHEREGYIPGAATQAGGPTAFILAPVKRDADANSELTQHWQRVTAIAILGVRFLSPDEHFVIRNLGTTILEESVAMGSTRKRLATNGGLEALVQYLDNAYEAYVRDGAHHRMTPWLALYRCEPSHSLTEPSCAFGSTHPPPPPPPPPPATPGSSAS